MVYERIHLRRFFSYFGVDCVFDVGANRGQYASMLRDIGFRGPIISYEPIPSMAETLRALSTNDPAWYVEELALDREAGLATFHLMDDSEFSSLHTPAADQPDIFKSKNVVRRDVRVTRATLGDELPKWRSKLGFKRPFLKMDTQGNDHAVAVGAGEAIQAFVGLQSELAIRKIYEDALGFSETLRFYMSQGFELSALVPNNAGHFPLLVEMDCVMFNRAMALQDAAWMNKTA
jgi:FkbM family methyltransferase